MPSYGGSNVRADAAAGLTVAVMLVPQAMAYAMLAGLPPVVGLYAATLPLFAYALFGTSRQLAVGPVAMVSLMVASGVGALATPGSAEYIALAALLALMVGVLQVAMGTLRLGFVVNFLSRPVISGFTAAAAVIIALSQLKHLLGVAIPRGLPHETLAAAIDLLPQTNGPTLLIGLLAIGMLLGLRKVAPRAPGALIVVVLTTLLTRWLDLRAVGVSVVGDVPAGLPALHVPELTTQMLLDLAPSALAISLVGFVGAISVARVFATKHNYRIDANSELIGLGIANLASGFVGGYAVTGGFARSAVNDQAGARTPMAAMVTGAAMLIALAWLTGLFADLPTATLAAIIMVAVTRLVDPAEVAHLWRVKRADLAMMAVTFFATLGVGVQEGIATGVGLSMLWFVTARTRPNYAVLGRLPGTTVYRNVKNYPEATTHEGVLALRFDAAIYYGNVSFLLETLQREEAAMASPLREVVLDASGVNDLDSSAARALQQLTRDYRDRNVTLRFAAVKRPVMEVMHKTGLVDDVSSCNFFHTVADAISATDAVERPSAGPNVVPLAAIVT